MSKVHEVKISSLFFDNVACGREPFELRVDDQEYQVGDYLVLQEYSNRETIKVISYKIDGGKYGLDKLYCCLGLRELTPDDYNIKE
mgnify:CR=1 FL=1